MKLKSLSRIAVMTLLTLTVVSFQNCAKAPSAGGATDGQVLPGTFDHQITGQYSATISYGGASQSKFDDYSFDFNEDAAGNLTGRHNFQGIQSGFKKIAGTRSGNTFNYHSTECTGDTFSGSFSLVNGNGSFSGTICGYNFQGGTLSGMTQIK